MPVEAHRLSTDLQSLCPSASHRSQQFECGWASLFSDPLRNQPRCARYPASVLHIESPVGRRLDILRLTSATIKDFESGIRPKQLAPVFQDAIRVASSLSLRYLWIDSLCIQQDSATDLLEQTLQMDKIFENAVLTIAAVAASWSNDRFLLARNLLELERCKIAGTFARGVWMEPHRPRMKDNLEDRGWCFQERVLSRAILSFGLEGMYWTCRQGTASEVEPEGYEDDSDGRLAVRWRKIFTLAPFSNSPEIRRSPDRIFSAFDGLMKPFKPGQNQLVVSTIIGLPWSKIIQVAS